jgi:4,5-DOPA dioxygenase extradiol
VHNLRDLDRSAETTPAWAKRFDDWLASAIETGDTEALLDWEQAPEARRAHPSDDHFLPIFVAMGAAGRGFHGRRVYEGFSLGSLSLAAFRFD